MKKNRKQWMKYAAVILSFLIMAGFFMPGTKTQVNATETDGSVSGGNIISNNENGSGEGAVVEETNGENEVITYADSWSVTVSFLVNEGEFPSEVEEIHFPSGGNVYRTYTTTSGADTKVDTITIPNDLQPTKEGYKFAGWLCNIDNIIYQPGETTEESTFSKGNITFTAQWEWDGKSIIVNEPLLLKSGEQYTLDSGTWTVNSDGYSYTGGTTFYVGTDGSYTFTKN